MKNIDEKILVADEEMKQLQNKRKKLISQQKQEERKKRDKRIYEKGAVFESIFTESKTLAISKWEPEVATLKKEKKSLYNQILEIREEVEQAEKVKVCIEQLQVQEKRLSHIKRNELEIYN